MAPKAGDKDCPASWRKLAAAIFLVIVGAFVGASQDAAGRGVPHFESHHVSKDTPLKTETKDQGSKSDESQERVQERVENDANIHKELRPEATEALRSAKLGRTLPLDSNLPGLSIRLADDPSYDMEIMRYSWYKLVPPLRSTLAVKSVRVASIVQDPATQEAFTSKLDGRVSAGTKKLRDLLIGKIPYSPQTLEKALRPLAGTFLIVLGHIDKSSASFEHMEGKEKTSISISDLMDAARRADVNIIPAGCESALHASIGTTQTVNSIDVIERIAQALKSVSVADAQVYDFLKALTGIKFSLSVNILDFELYRRVKMDVVSENGVVVDAVYWSPAARPMSSTEQTVAGSSVLAPPWVTQELADEQAFKQRYFDAYSLAYSALMAGIFVSWFAGMITGLYLEDDTPVEDLLVGLVGHFFGGLALLAPAAVASVRAVTSYGLFMTVAVVASIWAVLAWRSLTYLGRSRLVGLALVALLFIRAKMMLT